MACCNPCCHGSPCNVALRVISLILGLLAFCIHCAACGHTFWLCLDLLCWERIGLWNGFSSIWIKSLEDFKGGYFDGAYIKACGAFNVLALLSSFMAFIFMCVRFCVVKKPIEYLTLFWLFGAFGCQFLVWVIFVAVRAEDLDKPGYHLGSGFGCAVCSMVFSFLCFVMICVSIKITGPIVRNPKTVVVVNSNAGQQAVVVQDGTQVVMAAPPQQQQQVVYANQQPPAYGEGEYKQPGQPGY